MSRRQHPNLVGQKATEARHLARMLELAEIDAHSIPGEGPDFVFVTNDRRVGLEHQELTEEDLARTDRNIDLLEEALDAELRRAGCGGDVLVSVGVDAAAPFFRKRRDVEHLAVQLATLAAGVSPGLAPGGAIELAAAELAARGIAGPRFVAISAGHATGPRGFVARGAWVGPSTVAVETAIREKEELLARYAASDPSIEEFWLLLVTGETWLQGTDSALTEGLRISTAFARVYLLDLRAGALQRIDASADAVAKDGP